MRNSIISKCTKFNYFVAIAILIAGCTKENNHRFNESENTDENYKNIMTNVSYINNYNLKDMQSYTQETQQLIFSVLTPANQARLVKERIESAIKNETNTIRIEKLNQLNKLIDSNLYKPNRNSIAVESVIKYVESIFPLFGFENMKSIVTTWGGEGLDSISIKTSGMRSYGVTCKCSSDDDWCSGIGSCGNSKCDPQRWGCGTLWMSSCDGICTLGIPASGFQWNSF
jgi:hypothetical protein